MIESLHIHPADRPNVIGMTIALEPSVVRSIQYLSEPKVNGDPYRFHDLLLSSLSEGVEKLTTYDIQFQAVAANLMQERPLQPIDEWAGKPTFKHLRLWVPKNLLDSLDQIAATSEVPFGKLTHNLIVNSLPQSS